MQPKKTGTAIQAMTREAGLPLACRGREHQRKYDDLGMTPGTWCSGNGGGFFVRVVGDKMEQGKVVFTILRTYTMLLGFSNILPMNLYCFSEVGQGQREVEEEREERSQPGSLDPMLQSVHPETK